MLTVVKDSRSNSSPQGTEYCRRTNESISQFNNKPLGEQQQQPKLQDIFNIMQWGKFLGYFTLKSKTKFERTAL
jgi:hypothetical protein